MPLLTISLKLENIPLLIKSIASLYRFSGIVIVIFLNSINTTLISIEYVLIYKYCGDKGSVENVISGIGQITLQMIVKQPNPPVCDWWSSSETSMTKKISQNFLLSSG